jgi:hypothetical protein
MLDKYKDWVHLMWVDNCNERDSWAMNRVSKEEYMETNKEFLENEFCLYAYGEKKVKGKYYDWL